VVCDDASDTPMTEAPASLVERLPGIRFIPSGHRSGPAATRNRGIACARGEIVVFLDDDVVPAPGHLSAAATALESNPEASGVEGPVRSDEMEAFEKAGIFANTVETQSSGNYLTANTAYRTSVLVKVGGFDEGFPDPACEDYDLAWRVTRSCGPIAFEEGLLVTHAVHGEQTIRSLLKKCASGKTANIRLFLKHPDRFPPAWVVARFGRIFRHEVRPSLTQLVAYFVLADMAHAVSTRQLILVRPRLAMKTIAFAILGITQTFLKLPLMLRQYRCVLSETALAPAQTVLRPLA